MSYDPNKIYHAILETGEDWADKKSAYELLNDMSKSVLAQCKKLSTGKSDAERTTDGLANLNYTQHIGDVAEARHAFLHAEVKFKATQSLADAKRTEASNRRTETKYLNMQPG